MTSPVRRPSARKLLYNTQGGAGADPDAFNQHFAIVLDREIQSWPSIDFNDYPNGISGGNGAQITGDFTIGEARDLALVLQTGALPVKFISLDQTEISATLGRTRSRRRRSPSSRACCSSRSSCSSSTASWASSRSSGSGCTRRCSTRRS